MGSKAVREAQAIHRSERLAHLALFVRRRRATTLTDAFNWGALEGFYVGGDGPLVQDDLNALCASSRAQRHDGYWKTGAPRSIRWPTYWTGAGRG